MPDGIMAFIGPAPGAGPAGRPAPLSPEQREAVGEIKDFLADTARRVFVVNGLAGTGKTHLLGRIAQTPLNPLVCAPTGKAAAVLRERFNLKAMTIHAAFYRLKSESQRADGRRDLTFSPRRRDGSLTGRVVLIDEASMVTAQLRDDLLATGARIIAFGDEGQLQPVGGEPGFPRADFTLAQIHRQALGSPIIRQAHAVRAGGDYAPDGDAFRVVAKGTHDLLREADVVLCWTNTSRRFLNQLARRVAVRSEVPGRPADDGSFDPRTEFPRQFELVTVLRNAPKHDLWNGDVEWLDQDIRSGARAVSLFRVSESGDSAGGIEFPLASFAGMPGAGGDPGGLQLDFGYCRTVHSAQGSEWRNVLILDEFPRSNPERSRWLYTALTRASERVVIVNRHYR
jgi:exodeoxyribonuclease-5